MRYFRFTWQVKISPFTEDVGMGISPVIVAKTEEEARGIFAITGIFDEIIQSSNAGRV